jgi:hypothetical protein
MKLAVRDEIDGALGDVDVRIALPNDRLGGDDPANIVNRITVGRRHGVQVEQDDHVREHRWREVADAVATVYARILGTAAAPTSGS